MARSSALRPLLLVLALLAGQWLAFTHGLQHSALNADSGCQLCLQAEQLGTGAPVAAASALEFTARFEAPRIAPPTAAASRPLTAYRSRAPPVSLV